ncbi:solute carrier family 2, facilitated glucose transporter member 11-like [Vipera latastei]
MNKEFTITNPTYQLPKEKTEHSATASPSGEGGVWEAVAGHSLGMAQKQQQSSSSQLKRPPVAWVPLFPILLLHLCFLQLGWSRATQAAGSQLSEDEEEKRVRLAGQVKTRMEQSHQAAGSRLSGEDEERKSGEILCQLSGQVQYRQLFQMVIVLGMSGTLLIGFQVSVITYPSQLHSAAGVIHLGYSAGLKITSRGQLYQHNTCHPSSHDFYRGVEDIKSFINGTWLQRHGVAVSPDRLAVLWSFIISIYCLGGLLGCLWSGSLAMRYGKKKTLICSDFIIIVGALLIGSSKMARSFEIILMGRFLYGISAGLCLNIHGPYLSEISPKKFRGLATTTAAVFFSLGKALGQILGLRDLLGTKALWPLLLALCGFPALLQLLLLPFFPESPPYLLLQRKDADACQKAMKDLWGERHQQLEIEEALKEMTIAGSKNLSIWEVMKEPSLRWPLLIAILLVTSLQLCGLSAIYFYAFEVFRTARLEELVIPYVTLGIGLCEFASVLLCSSIIDRLGRRVLLWGGFGMMALTLALLVLTLSLQEALGHYCFLIFFGVLIGMGLFTYLFIPETKGRSIQDITEDLNRIPLGKRRTLPALESSSPLRSHGLCTKL